MSKLASLLIIVLLISCQTTAQKILLKIGVVTAAGGEEVRAVDFKFDNLSIVSGGGHTSGKVQASDLMIKKTNNTSTNDLFKKVLNGSRYPEVKLEYYDNANALYFTLTLKDVIVTQFYWLSPECPTCLKLEHQVAFAPLIIESLDSATGVKVTYNFATNVAN